MALAANEVMISGFVRDVADSNSLVTTETTAGAVVNGGFLRDPDGRLVTTTVQTNAAMSSGFLRAPNGSLVVQSG